MNWEIFVFLVVVVAFFTWHGKGPGYDMRWVYPRMAEPGHWEIDYE